MAFIAITYGGTDINANRDPDGIVLTAAQFHALAYFHGQPIANPNAYVESVDRHDADPERCPVCHPELVGPDGNRDTRPHTASDEHPAARDAR